MYSLSEIRRGLTEPRTALREVNRLCHTRAGRRPYNPRGIDVFEADWDNLVILDACRYDSYREATTLDGRLERRTSRAGATSEFVRANFSRRTLHDTVYVTANSWYLRLADELGTELHDVVDLHMHPDGRYHDEEVGVVRPEVLTERAIDVAEQYPNKRLVVHYIQPHHPFLGPTGREHFDLPSSSMEAVLDDAGNPPPSLVRRAYRENLSIALDSVERLADALTGKTVISSDHGEMLGERHDFVPIRDYGHHVGIYCDVLTAVPWHVLKWESRKEIVPERPRNDHRDVDPERLDRRLADLGYIT